MKQHYIGLVIGWFVLMQCLVDAPIVLSKDLQMFVGAGLRQPVDKLIQEFQHVSGHRVTIDYGGGGQLLAKINVMSKGDLYIPGALFYIEKLEKAGKIHSYRSIVLHTPVIGVNIKCQDRIRRFEDLAKPDIRLAIGDPKAMAFGRKAASILEKSGIKKAILKNVTVYGATVKQLAMYVSQGVVDAAIIGRADAYQNKKTIKILPIPKAYFQPDIVAVAVLKSAKDYDVAASLRDYLSSQHALEVFQHYGFLPLIK